ncbi:peptidylprolyl isomerase [Spirochaetota bacterium]
MTKAENGKKVKVHYTGTLSDGTVFDSSVDSDPLEFTLGKGEVINGFEQGVLGMEINEKKTINISAQEAYGERNDTLIVNVPKNEVPDNITPEVGQQLVLQNEQGQKINVVITKVDEEGISIDANHPLAGMDLNFELELLEVI